MPVLGIYGRQENGRLTFSVVFVSLFSLSLLIPFWSMPYCLKRLRHGMSHSSVAIPSGSWVLATHAGLAFSRRCPSSTARHVVPSFSQWVGMNGDTFNDHFLFWPVFLINLNGLQFCQGP